MINPLVHLKANNISFTGDMIPAIFEGIKRQTRRPLKEQPKCKVTEIYAEETLDFTGTTGRFAVETLNNGRLWVDHFIESSYGKPGDLLWVQEGYRILGGNDGHVIGRYAADNELFNIDLTESEYKKLTNRKYPFRKSPGRFMYKSLCRLVIEVEAVKFERVQDISEKDACKEGVKLDFDITQDRSGRKRRIVHHYWHYEEERWAHALNMDYAARSSFQTLWDSMYAGTEFAWAKNPWVEVIKFKPVDLEKLKAWIQENRELAEAGIEQFSRQILLEEARSEKSEGVQV